MVSRLPVPYLKIALRPWLTEPGSVSDPPAQATVVNAKTIAVNAAKLLIVVFMVASSDSRADAAQFELDTFVSGASLASLRPASQTPIPHRARIDDSGSGNIS